MANEFIVRNGFTSKFDVVVSGSLLVTSGITGSLATASYAITAGFSLQSLSASLTNTIATSSYSTFALTSSQATLGSFVPQYSSNYTTTPASASLYTSLVGGHGFLSPMYTPHVTTNAAQNNRQLNTIYLTPLYINSNCVVKRIGIPVQRSAATVGVRLGIYTNSNSMLPENNILDENLTPIANLRVFHDVAVSSTVNLQAGEIYWLASMLTGPVAQPPAGSNINYLSIQWLDTAFSLSAFNRIINPLLGSSTPVNQNAIRHISYYSYVTATTSSLPSTLPQTALSYTPYAYGEKLSIGGVNSTNAFIPPMIQVSYN